ncbi:hypothetical protein MTO96_016739 [Rhipicephalus appendiculatus]
MSLMKQTALTRYYNAKKPGPALKSKRTTFGGSVDTLRTPKTAPQGLDHCQFRAICQLASQEKTHRCC